MITKIDGESTKKYQALCDYWRLGAGRSLNQLYEHYSNSDNPPCKTYNTLRKWHDQYNWEERIANQIEQEQKLIEDLYIEELIKNAKRRFDIIEDMFALTQEIDVDVEMVSVAQATGLYKALLDAIGKTFNLDAPEKIALTDPTGKKEYMQNDVSELLKLADAAKRRPE